MTINTQVAAAPALPPSHMELLILLSLPCYPWTLGRCLPSIHSTLQLLIG
jgi:hypothetical protein